MKVYHKKNHHKRGIKILEVDHDDIQKALEIIQKETNILNNCMYSRWWKKDGKTFMDYGSHYAYLVFVK